MFLKNDSYSNFVACLNPLNAAFFEEDSHYAALRKNGQDLSRKKLLVRRKLLDRDARKFALTDLRHDCLASGDSKRFVRHLFTIQPHTALLNHP